MNSKPKITNPFAAITDSKPKPQIIPSWVVWFILLLCVSEIIGTLRYGFERNPNKALMQQYCMAFAFVVGLWCMRRLWRE